ncbi:MAG: ABC transporter ATP-binding protein [Firmicutes bacterium]|nr:ABC transporter ATP-binding protein [Bacillota bacterium]
MRYLWKAFWLGPRHWWRRFAALTGMIIDGGTIIVVPMLMKSAFDVIGKGADQAMGTLTRIGFWLVALAFIRAVGIYTEIYFQENTGNYIGRDLRSLIFQKLLYLPFPFFDRNRTGDLMSILTRDVDAVRDGTGFVVLIIVVNMIQTVGMLIAMLRLDLILSIAVLSLCPLIFIVTMYYGARIGPIYRKVQEYSGRLHSAAQENISGIRVVKAFSREYEEGERFGRENAKVYQANLDVVRLNSLTHPTLDFLGAATGLIALIAGGMKVINHQMSLGTLVAFTSFAGMIIWPIRQIGWLAELVQRASAGAARIYKVLGEPDSMPEPDKPFMPDRIAGHIRFEKVGFNYQDSDEAAILDFNLDVPPGRTVALLGPTGSGKTTVANLIPRFYDATAGRVTIDGVDVREWSLETLRRNIGFVFQDNFLFSDTVRENIAIGKPDAPQSLIEQAARVAQAHDFISAFPLGYETIIGERGLGLSGGEQQRIAIARALLVDPPIIILDDSSASLDMKTEATLRRALNELFKGRTVVIVTQRVSSAMMADEILLMDGGMVVERGTHDELLALGGAYKALYDVQMGDAKQWHDEALSRGGDALCQAVYQTTQ